MPIWQANSYSPGSFGRSSTGTGSPSRMITAPLGDAAGKVHQVLEVARDVTELVEMEERLEQANQARLDARAWLVEQERLAPVGQVVVVLHHAILNPLTGILGPLEVLEQVRLARPRRLAPSPKPRSRSGGSSH